MIDENWQLGRMSLGEPPYANLAIGTSPNLLDNIWPKVCAHAYRQVVNCILHPLREELTR